MKEEKLVGMGLLVHQAEGQGKKLAPFQGVDQDHIALFDTQEAERVQIAAGPQERAPQLHI